MSQTQKGTDDLLTKKKYTFYTNDEPEAKGLAKEVRIAHNGTPVLVQLFKMVDPQKNISITRKQIDF